MFALGVGSRFCKARHDGCFAMLGVNWFAVTVGVANNPDPVAPVRGTDGTSRNNKRPAGVAECFQVRKHIIEAHADVPSNVLSNDPSWPEFRDKAPILRPEVAVVFRAPALPGCGERLAWITAANNVNWSNVVASQFAHVAVDRCARPMLRQNAAREFLDLAEGDSFKSARAFKAKAEAADAAEQVKDAKLVGKTPSR